MLSCYAAIIISSLAEATIPLGMMTPLYYSLYDIVYKERILGLGWGGGGGGGGGLPLLSGQIQCSTIDVLSHANRVIYWPVIIAKTFVVSYRL